MERKNFLRTFVLAAAAGPMIIDACKKDPASSSNSSTGETWLRGYQTTDAKGAITLTPYTRAGMAAGQLTSTLRYL